MIDYWRVFETPADQGTDPGGDGEAPETPAEESPAEPGTQAPEDGETGTQEAEGAAPATPPAAPAAPSEPIFEIDGQKYTAAEIRTMQKRLADSQAYIRSGGHKRGEAPPEGFEGPEPDRLSAGIFNDQTPPRSLRDYQDWFAETPEEATAWALRNPNSVPADIWQHYQSVWSQADRESYDRFWEPIREQQRMAQLQRSMDERYAPVMAGYVHSTSATAETQVREALGSDLYGEIENDLATLIGQYPKPGQPGALFSQNEIADPTGQAMAQKILRLADYLIGQKNRSSIAEQRKQAAAAAAEAKQQETMANAHAKVGETRGNAGGGSSEPVEGDDLVERAVRRAQGKTRIPG